ncbi:MAG: hypothetical protein J5693_06415 [Bacteroidales bacterium]|nr:hypothetical protein [Bacteroidales bacterium]
MLFRRRKRPLSKDKKAQILYSAAKKLLKEKLYLDSGLKCTDLSKEICTNRTYVWETLRSLDLGFQDYVCRFRLAYFIEHAREFRGLSSPEISERCGFSDPRQLNRQLKQLLGVTIQEYMDWVVGPPPAT